jgi:methionyl-tRNA formyltransferase
MIDRVSVPIGPDDTSVMVEEQLAERGATLLLTVVDRFAEGGVIETPQDHSAATYAPKIVKTEGPVDWSRPARTIHNMVRGLQPWPLASTTIGGVRCLIHRTALVDQPGGALPGTITHAAGETIIVATGEGSIGIVQLQPEGRRPMPARDFLSGHKLAPGTRLPS